MASVSAFFSDVFKRRQAFLSFIMVFCSFCFLFFVLGLRDVSVGIDTEAYYKIFEVLAYEVEVYSEFRYEPGYVFLNQVVSNLGFEAPVAIFIAALISLASVFVFAYRNSPSLVVSVALMVGVGVYGFMFNGVRQGVAIGFLLLSLDSLLRGRFCLYVILVALAASFHYTALVFLSCLFLIRFNYNWVIATGLWVLSFVFLVPGFSDYFLGLLSFFVPATYSSFVSGDMTPSAVRLRIFTDQIFCVFFIYAIFRKNLFPFDRRCLAFLYISFFGFVLSNVFFILVIFPDWAYIFSLWR